MTASRLVVVKDGVVTDAIFADKTNFQAPPGTGLVESNSAKIGDKYDGQSFTSPTPSADTLVGYAKGKRTRELYSGLSVNVAQSPAPEELVWASTDPSNMTFLQYTYTLAQSNPLMTVPWSSATGGGSVTLTAAQVGTLYAAVAQHISKTMAAYGQAIAGIKMTPPTITTTAQVDALFS